MALDAGWECLVVDALVLAQHLRDVLMRLSLRYSSCGNGIKCSVLLRAAMRAPRRRLWDGRKGMMGVCVATAFICLVYCCMTS